MSGRKVFSLLIATLFLYFVPPVYGKEGRDLSSVLKKIEERAKSFTSLEIKGEITGDSKAMKGLLATRKIEVGLFLHSPYFRSWSKVTSKKEPGKILLHRVGFLGKKSFHYFHNFEDKRAHYADLTRREDLHKALLVDPLWMYGVIRFRPHLIFSTPKHFNFSSGKKYQKQSCYLLESPRFKVYYNEKDLSLVSFQIKRKKRIYAITVLETKKEKLAVKGEKVRFDIIRKEGAPRRGASFQFTFREKPSLSKAKVKFQNRSNYLVRDMDLKSREYYRKKLKKSPQNDRLLYSLALRTSGKKEYSLYEKLLKLKGKNPWLYSRLIYWDLKEKNYKKARERAAQIEKKKVKVTPLLAGKIGEIYLKSKDYKRARQWLEKALKEQGRNFEIRKALIEVYLQEKSLNLKALSQFKKLYKKKSSVSSRHLIQLIDHWKDRKSFDHLVQVVEKELIPRVYRLYRAKIYGALASKYLKYGKVKKAKKIYQKAVNQARSKHRAVIDILRDTVKKDRRELAILLARDYLQKKDLQKRTEYQIREVFENELQRIRKAEKFISLFEDYRVLLGKDNYRDISYTLKSRWKTGEREKLYRLLEKKKGKKGAYFFLLGEIYRREGEGYKKIFLAFYHSYLYSSFPHAPFKIDNLLHKYSVKKDKALVKFYLKKMNHLLKVKKKSPDYPYLLKITARLYFITGEREKGKALLVKALPYFSSFKGKVDKKKTRELKELLRLFYRNKLFEEALLLSEKIISKINLDDRSHNSLQRYVKDLIYDIVQKSRDEKDVIEGAELLRHFGVREWATCLKEKLRKLKLRGGLNKFAEKMEKSYGQARGKARAKYASALAYSNNYRGDLAKALKWYRASLEADSSRIDALNLYTARIHLLFHSARTGSQKKKALMEEMKKLEKHALSHRRGLYILGQFFYQYGEKKRGLKLLKKCLKKSLADKDLKTLSQLVRLFIKNKNYPMARQGAQKMLALAEKEPKSKGRKIAFEAREYLLRVEVGAGKLEAAASHLAAYLISRSPGHYSTRKFVNQYVLNSQGGEKKKSLAILGELEKKLASPTFSPGTYNYVNLAYFLSYSYALLKEKKKAHHWSKTVLKKGSFEHLDEDHIRKKLFYLYNSCQGKKDFRHLDSFLNQLSQKKIYNRKSKFHFYYFWAQTLFSLEEKKKGLQKCGKAKKFATHYINKFKLAKLYLRFNEIGQAHQLLSHRNRYYSRSWRRKREEMLKKIYLQSGQPKVSAQLLLSALSDTRKARLLSEIFDDKDVKSKNLEKLYQEVKKAKGNSRQYMGFYLFGRIFYKSKEYGQTLEALESILFSKISKEALWLWENTVEKKMRKTPYKKDPEWYKKALERTKKALKKDSDNLFLNRVAASLLLAMNRKKDSLAHLQRLVKVYKKDKKKDNLLTMVKKYNEAGGYKEAGKLANYVEKNFSLRHYEKRRLKRFREEGALKSGDYKLIARDFKSRLTSEKSNYRALRFIRLLDKLGHLEGFFKALPQHFSSKEKKSLAYYALYEFYQKKGKRKSASVYLKKAVMEGGARPGGEILEKWVRYLLRKDYPRKNYRKTKNEKREVREKLKSLVSQFQKTLKIYPQAPYVHSYMYYAYKRLGEKKKAVGHLGSASEGYLQLGEYKKAYQWSDKLMKEGEVAGAEKILKEVVRARSKGKVSTWLYRRAFSRLAVVFAKRGKVAPLLALFEKEAKGKNQRASYDNYKIWKALKESQKLAEVQKAFEKAASKKASPMYLEFLYYSYKREGNYRQAARVLERWVKREPKNYRRRAELAEMYKKLRFYSRASRTYEEVIKITTRRNSRAKYRREVIDCYIKLGRKKKILHHLKKYKEDAYSSYRVQKYAIGIYEKMKMYSQVIAIYKELAQKSRYSYQRADYWLEIGRYYELKKDYEKAREIYTWIARLGRRSDVRQAKKRLSKLPEKKSKKKKEK